MDLPSSSQHWVLVSLLFLCAYFQEGICSPLFLLILWDTFSQLHQNAHYILFLLHIPCAAMPHIRYIKLTSGCFPFGSVDIWDSFFPSSTFEMFQNNFLQVLKKRIPILALNTEHFYSNFDGLRISCISVQSNTKGRVGVPKEFRCAHWLLMDTTIQEEGLHVSEVSRGGSLWIMAKGRQGEEGTNDSIASMQLVLPPFNQWKKSMWSKLSVPQSATVTEPDCDISLMLMSVLAVGKARFGLTWISTREIMFAAGSILWRVNFFGLVLWSFSVWWYHFMATITRNYSCFLWKAARMCWAMSKFVSDCFWAEFSISGRYFETKLMTVYFSGVFEGYHRKQTCGPRGGSYVLVHCHVCLVFSLGCDKTKFFLPMLFLSSYWAWTDCMFFEATGAFFHFLSSFFLDKALMWPDLPSIWSSIHSFITVSGP